MTTIKDFKLVAYLILLQIFNKHNAKKGDVSAIWPYIYNTFLIFQWSFIKIEIRNIIKIMNRKLETLYNGH